MNRDFTVLEEKLKAEKQRLEGELSEIAQADPKNPNKWQVVAEATDPQDFRDETADRLEEWEDRGAATAALELRLQEVNQALEKLAIGAYGRCGVCGDEIEADRLAANPAAGTCKKHLG